MSLHLRRRMKRAGAEVLLRTGALTLARQLRVAGTAPVLLYHRVNDEADPFFPSLPLAVFRRQLDFLQRHYRVVSLPEAVEWVESGARGTPRAALTIDDGFPDTYASVLPELSSRNLTATLFLSTGPLEDGVPLWTERLRLALKHATGGALSLPHLGLRSVTLATREERLSLAKRLLRRMKALGKEEVDRTLASVIDQVKPSQVTHPVLRWSDVRTMTSSGHIQLGGHTHRHYILSRLEDDAVEREITTSVELIEERLGIRVDTFCYPNGTTEDYDVRSIAVVKSLGMHYAATTRAGFVHRGAPAFELPRLYTSERHLAVFAARLSGLGAVPLTAPVGGASPPKSLSPPSVSVSTPSKGAAT